MADENTGEKTESFEDIEKELDSFYNSPTEVASDARTKMFLIKTPNAYKTLIECYLKMIKRKEPSILAYELKTACHFELITAERMLEKFNLLGLLKREKVGIAYAYSLVLDEQGKPKLLKYLKFATDLRNQDNGKTETEGDADGQ